MIKLLISLLRVKQWYKNLLIFLPIIFIGHLFNLNEFKLILIGFFSLCFVSSSYYIFNDLLDLKEDRIHPEKSKRPIAAGRIGIYEAFIIGLILFSLGSLIALALSFYFFVIVFFLFVFTLLYSIFLKKAVFLDILGIGINFVTRAVAGAILLNVVVSPWLVLCPFFLALFLATGKRKADLEFLEKDAVRHRKVLDIYSHELTNSLMIITTTALIISYSLYIFMGRFPYLMITLPFALYVIFKYLYLVYSSSDIVRHPELVYKDRGITIGTIVWVLLTVIIVSF